MASARQQNTGTGRVGSGGNSRRGPQTKGHGDASPGGNSSSKARAAKPSDRLNPKTVDPFSASSRGKSAFAQMYVNGGVPCRLVHGSVRHSLQWTAQIDTVPFDPVLITLAEGVQETVHPYSFVARQGYTELLSVEGAVYKVEPILPKIAQGIRGALGHKDGTVFAAGLTAMVQLSSVVGPALNPQLKTILVPISKRMMDKKYKEDATCALHALEENGGKDALLAIKGKIPTYQTINF